MHRKNEVCAVLTGWLALAALGCAAASASSSPSPSPVANRSAAASASDRCAVTFPGPQPGAARGTATNGVFILENDVLAVSWATADGQLRPLRLVNKLTGGSLDQAGAELFRLSLGADGATTAVETPASGFRLTAPPALTRIQGAPGSLTLVADLQSDRGVRARWRAILADGANYLRETLDVAAASADVPLSGVEFMDVRVADARTVGRVPGCPVTAAGWFFGVEMPGTRNTLDARGARLGFDCRLTLTAAQPFRFGAVMGVAPEGQLRRAFLCYLERERARPSRPFLHYNAWYDLGLNVNAAALLDVVTRFHEELTRKRGVKVAAYLVDDGWDNFNEDLWREDRTKFPGGFPALKRKIEPLDGRLGIWISPLGGYSGENERTAHARRMKLIPPDGKLDLSQPAYKRWFYERCLQLMREGGVRAFKWDKAGEGVSPHFMALLDIARALRKENPDLFINVTVGTWPSPFWLNHIDCTWRTGSADVGWAGKGDDREQWLTYRDGHCYDKYVQASPLYPLNSVMHHGIVHGRCYQAERVSKSGADLKHEARSYFASGATMQELYLTPSMMTPEAWDRVAEAARWAQAGAAALVDAHWVGGDPLKLEVYGYAAWSPRKGTLMLRNPDDRPQTYSLEVGATFELPAGAATRYRLASPYPDQRLKTLSLEAGHPQTITLEPFEVLVFDALPAP